MRFFYVLYRNLRWKYTRIGDFDTVIKYVTDMNEDTRMQIELINESLAELQSEKKTMSGPRPRIGFTP